MPNSIITSAGLALFAQAQAQGFTVPIDRMIFADISGLDTGSTPDPGSTRPGAAQIVCDAAIETVGRVDANGVVYSCVLTAAQGDWYINWIGLYSTVHQTLVAVCVVPRHQKFATDGFRVGNTLYKNFALQFANAAGLTGITIDAKSWQFDLGDRYEPQGTVNTHNSAADAHKALFDAKAPLASPALTGTPTAPTAAAGTNTTQLANTAFVTGEITRNNGAFLPIAGGTVTGAIISSSSREGFRLVDDTYGVLLHLANGAFYLVQTAPGDPRGTWNEARPLVINLETGECNINGGAQKDGNGRNIADTYLTKHKPTAESGIEISGDPQGYIDFHYQGDAADYTSRIIEMALGSLEVKASLNVTGKLSGQLDGSKTANGYVKLPNGVILQWGTATAIRGSSGEGVMTTITLPVAFPTAGLAAFSTFKNSGYGGGNMTTYADFPSGSKSQLDVVFDSSGSTFSGDVAAFWMAIGY